MDMTRLCPSCGSWYHYKLAACDVCGTVDPELVQHSERLTGDELKPELEGNRKMRRAAMSKRPGRKHKYKRLKKTRSLRHG